MINTIIKDMKFAFKELYRLGKANPTIGIGMVSVLLVLAIVTFKISNYLARKMVGEAPAKRVSKPIPAAPETPTPIPTPSASSTEGSEKKTKGDSKEKKD